MYYAWSGTVHMYTVIGSPIGVQSTIQAQSESSASEAGVEH